MKYKLFLITLAILVISTTTVLAQDFKNYEVDQSYDIRVIGNPEAPVTMVMYCDVTEPFCKEFYDESFSKLIDDYFTEHELKIIFKDYPIFDDGLAANAGWCAYEQQLFFPVLSEVFSYQENLTAENYALWVENHGGDSGQFNDCLNNQDYDSFVQAEAEEARRNNVSGSPTFLINGEKIVGAVPYSTFSEIIDKHLEKAQVDETEEAVVRIDQLTRSFGADDAPVTIVEYSDFTTGFSKRFYQDTFHQLLSRYSQDGLIRHIIKDYPRLGGENAANAAWCAEDQGLFIPFLDLIYENQDDHSNSNFVSWISSLEGNVDRFRHCIDQQPYNDIVEESREEAESLGITGVPSFIINGELLIGAQPIEVFEARIDEALANPSQNSLVLDYRPRRSINFEYETQRTEPLQEDNISDPNEEVEGIMDREIPPQEDNISDPNEEVEGIMDREIPSSEDLAVTQKPRCDSGCLYENNCLDVGHRLIVDNVESYCDVGGEIVSQASQEDSCQNNYECKSNQCSNGICIDLTKDLEETRGLLQAIRDFFSNIFG